MARTVAIATLGSERLRWDGVMGALDATMSVLGFRRVDKRPKLVLVVRDFGRDGVWIDVDKPSATIERLAQRLAWQVKQPVRSYALRWSGDEEERGSDAEIDGDGTEYDAQGRPRELSAIPELELEDLEGQLVTSRGEPRRYEVRGYAPMPAIDDDPRVARLVDAIRGAVSWKIEPVEGRFAVTVQHFDGGKETAFVGAAEAERIKGAIGG